MSVSVEHRFATVALGLCLLGLAGGTGSPWERRAEASQKAREYIRLEPDTDRPGNDYKNFNLSDARPEACQAECTNDAKCKAFTYVKPGIQGRTARCWLKTAAAKANADRCCVSGVKY